MTAIYDVAEHPDPGVALEFRPKFRTKKVNIVLISGKALAGKTTTAQYLQKSLNIYGEIEPLAKPIKLEASDFFGWDGNKDEKGRRLLQEIGDAAINYDPYTFARKLEERILNGIFMPYFVFIDDWRYPAEKEYFERNFLYELTTIRLEGRKTISGDAANHRSETALPEGNLEHLERIIQDSTYDFVVNNGGTLEDLFDKLNKIIAYLETKIITYSIGEDIK